MDKFAHKCRLLLWVNSPTPSSIMLRSKAMSDSVNYKYIKSCMPLFILRPVANGKDIGLEKASAEQPCWQYVGFATNLQLRHKAQMTGTAAMGGCRAQSTYIYGVQSSVWRLPNHWPPTPSPHSECNLPPAPKTGGGTHSPGGEGVEGQNFRRRQTFDWPLTV
jgi:hypothetical protein